MQVDRHAPGDREQEGAEGAAIGIEARGRLPDADPGLLHELLGQTGLAQRPRPEAVEAALVAAVQPTQRLPGVAGGDEGHQLRLGRVNGGR